MNYLRVVLVLVLHPLVHWGVDGHLGLRPGRLRHVPAPAAAVHRRHQGLRSVRVIITKDEFELMLMLSRVSKAKEIVAKMKTGH